MNDKENGIFDETELDEFYGVDEEEVREESEEDEPKDVINEKSRYKFYDRNTDAITGWPSLTKEERKQYEAELKNQAVYYAVTGDERAYSEIQKCLFMLIKHIFDTRTSKSDCPISVNAFHDIYQDCMIKLPKKYDPGRNNSFIAYFRSYLYKEIWGKRRDGAKQNYRESTELLKSADEEIEDLFDNLPSDTPSPDEQVFKTEGVNNSIGIMFKHFSKIKECVNDGGTREVLNNIYNEMFITAYIVECLRQTPEWGLTFKNHDKEIFGFLDDMFLEFTYRNTPNCLSDVEVNDLKTNREALAQSEIDKAADIVEKHPDEPLKIPFKNYVFCEYLFRARDINVKGKPVSIQSLSQRQINWRESMKEKLKLEEYMY